MKVGKPIVDSNGELCYFVAYCNDCNGKCLATKDQAKYIATRFARNKRPIKRRVIHFLEDHTT